jgi:hypothetical protein
LSHEKSSLQSGWLFGHNVTESRARSAEEETRAIYRKCKETVMAFTENLKQIPGVEDIEKLELIDEDGLFVATLENKPGKAGSLAVYNHLILRYHKINAAAAMEGLTLFAEHTNDAEKNPGKHPNIDRLFKVIEENLSLSAQVTRK